MNQAIEYATQCNNLEMAQFFFDKGYTVIAYRSKALVNACHHGNLKIITGTVIVVPVIV